MVTTTKIPNGYKQTKVGVIPEDWDAILIGDLFEFKNGLNKAKEFFGAGTPIVNYMDVYKYPGLHQQDVAGKVTLSRDEIRAYQANKGDVFFTRTSETVEEIGMSSVLLEDISDAVFSGFVLRARPKGKKLDLFFKKYCFRSSVVREQIICKSSYTTRALTNGRLLSNVFIATPKLDSEQQAIAEALSDTDELITSLEKLIAKKRNIKQAAMHQLLTGKKRLQGFNGKWETKKLGEVAHIKTGSCNNQDKIEDGEYPFFVRSATVERINSFSHDCEAILVPGEGGIGSIYHYIIGRFEVHQRVYAIREFKTGISGKFIYYFMVKEFGAHALENSVKATVDSLRLPTFENFEMNIPANPDEQTAIAEILSDMDAEIEDFQLRLDKYKMIKQGMMQELLTGKTRLI